MRKLVIVDTSSAVYAGSFNSCSYITGNLLNTASGYVEQYIPTGGVNQLFNIISKQSRNSTIVFACDRIPTEKRKKYAQYKTQRTPNPQAAIEKKIAEYVLKDCGFCVLAQDGYEADDIIATIATQQCSQYDAIDIYCADADLYYLVNETVSIKPPHSRAKEVTRDNYSYTCIKDRIIPYNCMPLEKLIKGDKSKGIDPLPKETARCLAQALNLAGVRERLGNKEFVTNTLSHMDKDILMRYELLAPLETDLPAEFELPSSYDRLEGWARQIQHKSIPHKRIDLHEQIEELFAMGLYLETGGV